MFRSRIYFRFRILYNEIYYYYYYYYYHYNNHYIKMKPKIDNIYESVWLQYDGKISLIVSSPPSSLEYCLTKLPIIRVHMYGVNNTENCTVIVKCHSSFYASTKKKKTSKCHERYLFTVKLKSSSTRACFRKKFYFTFHSLSFARFHFWNLCKKKKKKKRFYSHLKNSIFFSLLFFIDDFVDILYHDE